MSEPTFPPSDPRRTAASPWQRRLGVLLVTALLCGALPAQAQSGGSTRKPARTPATPKVAPAPAPVTPAAPAAPATPAAVVPGAAVAEAAAAPASRRGGDHIVAIVNRELVTNSEVQLRVARIEQEAARSGTRLTDRDTLQREVLDQLIDEQVVRLAADDAHIVIGDAAVRDYIAAIPAFQRDGKFNAEQYRMALAQGTPPRTPAIIVLSFPN